MARRAFVQRHRVHVAGIVSRGIAGSSEGSLPWNACNDRTVSRSVGIANPKCAQGLGRMKARMTSQTLNDP